MSNSDAKTPEVRRILAATDRSESADGAVRWAGQMASRHEAELLLLRVLVPDMKDGATAEVPQTTLDKAVEDLRGFAQEVAGSRGKAQVVVDGDPASAILKVVEQEKVDVVVVGNVGMAGRKQFLLGNIPNRISHNARCTVVIVNTRQLEGRPTPSPSRGEVRDKQPAVAEGGS